MMNKITMNDYIPSLFKDKTIRSERLKEVNPKKHALRVYSKQPMSFKVMDYVALHAIKKYYGGVEVTFNIYMIRNRN